MSELKFLCLNFLILFLICISIPAKAAELVVEEVDGTANFTLVNFSGRLALASFWISYDLNTSQYVGFHETLKDYNYIYDIMDESKDRGILKVIVYSVNPPILSNPVIISMKFKVKPGAQGWVSILKVDELRDFHGKDILGQSSQYSAYIQIGEGGTKGTGGVKKTGVVEGTEIETEGAEKAGSGIGVNETPKPGIKVHETPNKTPINKGKNVEKHGTAEVEKIGVDDHLKEYKEKHEGEEIPTTSQINTTQRRFVLGDSSHSEIYLWILGLVVIHIFRYRKYRRFL